MNAWAFGTVVLVVAICVTAWLLDRQADRGHEIRWHERFYQPQLPRRVGRVIDVDVGSGAWGVPQPHVDGQRRGQGIPRSTAKCAANRARPR